MQPRKCSFVESNLQNVTLNIGDTAGGDLGPSLSFLPGASTPRPHSRSCFRENMNSVGPWVWVLPPHADLRDTTSANVSEASSPSPAAPQQRLPWQRAHGGGSNGTSCSDFHEQRGDDGRWQQLWRLWSQQPYLQPPPQGLHQRCRALAGAADISPSVCTRPLLLASLSTSAYAASRVADGSSSNGLTGMYSANANTMPAALRPVPPPPSGSRDADGSSSRGPRPGFHLPQLSIMQLPGPPSFAEEQDLAQELLDYHTAKHGCFPRSCPRCKSSEFMVPRMEATPSTSAEEVAAAGARSNPGACGSDGHGDDRAVRVVEWRSRPLCCETCGRWVHLGCAGVEFAEEVPCRPWFHSRKCRDTYVRLEAAAERNPHPSSASPTHALYLLTPADHQAAALALPGASAAATSGKGSIGVRAAPGSVGGLPVGYPRERGPAGAVLPLLAQGFNPDAIQGFGQPAREYDGGKYSAVLLNRGQPVAAATFNVFGEDAQLCLLATAVQHRLKGNATALVTDLENILADLGVSRMLVQARGVALPLWLGRLGYSVVEPREAEQLHRRLPIAYYDCALLEKQLGEQMQTQQQAQVLEAQNMKRG